MATMDFRVKTERLSNEAAAIYVQGDIDLYRAPEVQEVLDELLLKGYRHLVINVEHVSFIDTTGIGVLIGALVKTKKRGGSLSVVAANPRFLRLLEMLRLLPAFDVFETIAQALEALQTKASRPGILSPAV